MKKLFLFMQMIVCFIVFADTGQIGQFNSKYPNSAETYQIDGIRRVFPQLIEKGLGYYKIFTTQEIYDTLQTDRYINILSLVINNEPHEIRIRPDQWFGNSITIKNSKGEITASGVVTVVIPGNSSIYVYCRHLCNPNYLEKIILTENSPRFVEQPLYLVDRKSKTSAIVTLYKEKSTDIPIVGYLRENAEINVIGFFTKDFRSCKAERWALISSELGLSGWVKIEYTGECAASYQPANILIFSDYSP